MEEDLNSNSLTVYFRDNIDDACMLWKQSRQNGWVMVDREKSITQDILRHESL